MTKLYSLILSLCLMFNIIGCTPATDIEQSAQSGIIAETIQTEASEPSNPREDLEVEIAPGVTSNYGLMRVHFIDVGQADSAFVELGNGQTILIDAGRSGNASTIVNYIKGLQYETIDYVVASHPHDDHIGGMATVLDSFNIGKMYMPKQAHTITAFTNTEILLGESKTLECEFTPENTTDKTVVWTTSDDSVISVSEDGGITANKLGTATITATHKKVFQSKNYG